MPGSTGPDWLALYGAVLSTLVAFWQGLQWWFERSRIYVSCYLAKKADDAVLASGANLVIDGGAPPRGWLPDHLLKRFIAFDVKNTGGKPVVVKSVGGHLKTGRLIMGIEGPVALPHTLEPGNSVLLMLALPVDLGTIMSLDHVKDLGIWDGLGRFRKARLHTLRAQYREWIKVTPVGEEAGVLGE